MTPAPAFTILQIHAPLVSPSIPPLAMADIAGWLHGPEIRIVSYDANLDFCNALTAAPGRESHADVTIRAQNFFQSNDFLNPSRLGYITSRLKKQFDPFFRNHILTGCGRFPGESSGKGGMRAFWDALEDPDRNPYAAFFQTELPGKIRAADPGLILIHAGEAGQVQAAWTIAAFCRRTGPTIPVILLSESGDLDCIPELIDDQAARNDWSRLPERMQRLGCPALPEQSSGPGFQGLSLDAYWLPARLLPFSVSTDPCGRVMPPQEAAAMVIGLARQHDARGFLLQRNILSVAYAHELAGIINASSPDLFLGLRCRLEPWDTASGSGFSTQGCVQVIEWHRPEERADRFVRDLQVFSRAGIWNHADFGQDMPADAQPLQAAAANPNIIHSWGRSAPGSHGWRDLGSRVPAAVVTPYERIRKLPGKPVWHLFFDPAQLLLYAKHHGVRKTMRMRVQADDGRAYTLGENLEYFFVKPGDLPPGYLDEICRMVEAGGSVGSRWVRYNLERAFLIAYVTEAGVIVGNSSLKHPRDEYIQAVREQSGLDFSNHLERGYTSVRSEYRGLGIGTRLLEGLTARADDRKIFSVISEDNHATQKIAIRNKTRQIAAFYSRRMGKQLGIWMPEWMIEEEPDR